MDLFVIFACLCHFVMSVSCSHVVTCRKRGDFLALLYVLFSCVCFCHFPIWCPGSGEVLNCIDS